MSDAIGSALIEQFLHAFIPLFVALDGVGLLPLFWSLTHRLTPPEREHAATEAVGTAFLVGVGFLLISRFIFSLLGLHLADVMVAGGAILCVLSLRDLLFREETPSVRSRTPGIVPLGVPLLAGPAVLTTVVLIRDRLGWAMLLLSLSTNLILVWLLLRSSEWLMGRLKPEGAEVISKVFSLILTAYGVMLMRQGIMLLIGQVSASRP